MVIRGLTARRSRPDLPALANEIDPERFVWAILPHAARSFSASIVVLPGDESRVAAVAYLYARMLDTYEDLLPDESARPAALRAFAARFSSHPHNAPLPIADSLAMDARDQLHILLVEKAELVDAVYATFTPQHQRAIADLVESMAEGMARSSELFVRQGGVLVDDDQLRRYCHDVIGHPAMFVIELLTGDSARLATDAFETSELIQLANITRDIEKDLARGIAYDPRLLSHLGRYEPEPIRKVRERLLGLALRRAPSYRRLYSQVNLKRRPGARLAAVLMLLFTDRHYRSMARKVGRTPWKGVRGKTTTLLVALPALVSRRYATAIIVRLSERMAAIGETIEHTPSAPVVRSAP